MAIWNLVDALSKPGERRAFYLPLASIPPGRTTVRTVTPERYQINADVYVPDTNPPSETTSDVWLPVTISPPEAGYVNEDNLPDPTFRLHAVGEGFLTFQPATASQYASLSLKMTAFAKASIQKVRWWQRWVEGDAIPDQFVYENVDVEQLRTLLQSTPAAQTPASGLAFPTDVTEASKTDFIQKFLTGSKGYFLVVSAGAYIGTAAQPGGTTRTSDKAQLLIRFHARYKDHTSATPQPMNTRELFHLLFGNDSSEATTHPLLRAIQLYGESQNAIHPRTKRSLLRPPLRTWKRVEWEAQQELSEGAADWAPRSDLANGTRLFNTNREQNRHFNNSGYAGFNKCNLFVSDICLRAGFHIAVHPVASDLWHYMDANSYANHVHQLDNSMDDRMPLLGSERVNNRQVVWGWKVENWLRGMVENNIQNRLNEAMQEEGRCFILAGARPRKFRTHELNNHAQGIADCARSLHHGIGHIIIVRAVEQQPNLTAERHHGLQSIQVRTMQASGQGVRIDEPGHALQYQLGGANPQPDATDGYIRLHLFELRPGRDPDIRQGLAELNVQNVNRNELGNAQHQQYADEERAVATRVTNRMDGTQRPPGCRCEDQHPVQQPIMVGNCPP